jgi:hypothetical protein
LNLHLFLNYYFNYRLFCEEIDVGEGVPRQIASGLREHYSLEEMQGRKVIVVCNLKEAKLQGFISYGMVLAAKNVDTGKVELLSPPVDAVVGERLYVSDESGLPLQAPAWPPNAMKKYKVWEVVAANLRTNSECVACWSGKPLLTAEGVCSVVSNANSQVS